MVLNMITLYPSLEKNHSSDMIFFKWFHVLTLADLTYCSGVFIVDLEQINVS